MDLQLLTAVFLSLIITSGPHTTLFTFDSTAGQHCYNCIVIALPLPLTLHSPRVPLGLTKMHRKSFAAVVLLASASLSFALPASTDNVPINPAHTFLVPSAEDNIMANADRTCGPRGMFKKCQNHRGEGACCSANVSLPSSIGKTMLTCPGLLWYANSMVLTYHLSHPQAMDRSTAALAVKTLSLTTTAITVVRIRSGPRKRRLLNDGKENAAARNMATTNAPTTSAVPTLATV